MVFWRSGQAAAHTGVLHPSDGDPLARHRTLHWPDIRPDPEGTEVAELHLYRREYWYWKFADLEGGPDV